MWQGFEGVVHGGIIAGLLDDAMWHALYHEHDLVTMTAQLTVRYRRPVPIDTLLNIYGTVTQFNRRIVHTKAWIESFGETLVTAEGVFMPPKEPPHD
ncbi:MAG: PaaI family thioesterase [Sulfobacillus thermosulfidooxidans]|nr:thioesterase [Sulfobacillus sp. hq2]PSR32616.1 MAG: PaaI family thioesterase [Sulfobacillus thermosulfidooxidans]